MVLVVVDIHGIDYLVLMDKILETLDELHLVAFVVAYAMDLLVCMGLVKQHLKMMVFELEVG